MRIRKSAIIRNGQEIAVPKPRIYLDHAATTPIRPEALAAMQEGFARWANPSSPHAEGRKAKQALENARERVKRALGWDGEVIFTSGASEALAIGLGRAKVDRRLVSAVEHDAVFRAAPDAEVITVAPFGLYESPELKEALSGEGRPLLCAQTVNSETGAVVSFPTQSNAALTKIVREAGGLLLADCSQSAGKLATPDVDMAVISAHKLGGPIGIGALLARDFAMLEPMGGHERGYRAGTENLPAILGFAAALECGDQDSWLTTESERNDFQNHHAQGGEWRLPGSVAAGQVDYITALTHPMISAQALLIRLDAMGIAVSAGSACSSGTLKKSRVLDAFGVSDDVAKRTIRVSLGWNTTPEELERFTDAWVSLAS